MINDKMNRLKELRLLNNLSQSELSKQSHIPLRTIQAYEQNQRKISGMKINKLIKLTEILKCNINDLIE